MALRRSARLNKEEHSSLSLPPLSLSSRSPSVLNDRTNIPDLERKYDEEETEEEEEKGEENKDPLDTLASAASAPHPRGKYGRHIDNDTRNRIIFLRTEFELSPAEIQTRIREQTGRLINIHTIRRIIRQQFNGQSFLLQKHRDTRKSFTEEEEKAVEKMQDDHNEWRYKDIRREFKRLFNKNISDWKIHSILKNGNFTEKNLQQVMAQRNSPENIEKRRQYCLRAISWDKERLIFIDESGFTKQISRKRGRSRKGTIAVQIQKTTDGT